MLLLLGTSTQTPVPGQVVLISANLGQGQQLQVRRVEFAKCWKASLYDEDLTGIDARSGPIRMVSCLDSVEAVAKPIGLTRVRFDSCPCAEFDLTYSDWNCEWTLFSKLANSVGHVGALPSLARDVDVILDFGADGSALPLSFSKERPEDLKLLNA